MPVSNRTRTDSQRFQRPLRRSNPPTASARPLRGLLVAMATAVIALGGIAFAPSCTLDPSGTAETGAGGGGGGGQACVENIDCPGLFTECQHPLCSSQFCATHYEPTGTSCTEDGGVVCDSSGECVECVDETQCSGGLVCDQHMCVDAKCVDGILNGDETDLDCGGGCAPCENGKFCGVAGDCQSGFCASNGTCAPCSGHGDCDVVDQWCDNGECAPKEQPGSECDDPVECVSGNCPVQDRACCDGPCDGLCYACIPGKTGGELGECLPVLASTDLDGDCPADEPTTCQSNGDGCDGSGSCILWPNDTVCDPQHCADGDTEHHDDTCDGIGSCDDNGLAGCSPYICEGDTCRSSCVDDTHCLTGAWCDVPNCVSQGNPGDPCGGDNECQSDHCVDGRCCESACPGECMACSETKTEEANGLCRAILHDTDPDVECASGACFRIDLTNAECRVYVGRPCPGGDGDCMNETCRDGFCCDSACGGDCMACRADWTGGNNGLCSAIVTGTDPANECSNGACYDDAGTGECRLDEGQPCGEGSECLNGLCVDDRCCESGCTGDCVACRGDWTVGNDGQCSAVTTNQDPNNECTDGACYELTPTSGECRSDQGQSCGSDSDCLNSTCRDTFCCDDDCGGDCQSCDGSETVGADGECSAVTDGTDPADDCDDEGAASCGDTGDCSGGTCEIYSTSTECAPESCTGETYTPARTCQSEDVCEPASATPCVAYACAGTVCGTACASDPECASGYHCEAPICVAD